MTNGPIENSCRHPPDVRRQRSKGPKSSLLYAGSKEVQIFRRIRTIIQFRHHTGRVYGRFKLQNMSVDSNILHSYSANRPNEHVPLKGQINQETLYRELRNIKYLDQKQVRSIVAEFSGKNDPERKIQCSPYGSKFSAVNCKAKPENQRWRWTGASWSDTVIEAKLLVDAALAGHAQHQLGTGADRTGNFHLLLLYRTRFH